MLERPLGFSELISEGLFAIFAVLQLEFNSHCLALPASTFLIVAFPLDFVPSLPGEFSRQQLVDGLAALAKGVFRLLQSGDEIRDDVVVLFLFER